MISANGLTRLVRSYNPKTDTALLRDAYAYGMAMHEGQTRRSGEPYFSHPVSVAAIMAELRLDDATLVTALLHDTIEDTKSTHEEIADRFGEEVAQLVEGVTSLSGLQFSSSDARPAENFRKLFMAMTRDLRVAMVKLGDRLHNMRTIRFVPKEKRERKALETMDVFAPLAGRIGMQWMREELEDLAFQVLNPDARISIMRRFVSLRRESGDVILKITSDIENELDKAGIRADVIGRAKRPYSIWRKMQEKDQGFSRLSDIYGFRIITHSNADCYGVLGAIHQRWRAVPGRFKDYISQPKSNGYCSIHTTVSGRDGKRVEVQIRSSEMNEVAEKGVAAHWSYRDGVRSENPFAVNPAAWFTDMRNWFETEESHQAFLEYVKLEMYSDQVFCFTPKGDVIKLPRGATPLDFAYAVHTRIGNSCVGAKIDHVRAPLWTRLKNGQSVEIMKAEGQRPHATWLDIVVTGKAKAAVRKSLREKDRERFVRLGRELVRVSFEHVGKKATDKALITAARQLGLISSNEEVEYVGRKVNDRDLTAAAHKLGLTSADELVARMHHTMRNVRDELLARIGRTEITAGDVVKAVYPDLTPAHGEEIDARRAIAGLSDEQTFERAGCCQPVPGERIVGITYPGRGIFIHAVDCEILKQFQDDSDNWMDLRWHSGRHSSAYGVTLNLTISNDAGVLGRICTLIGERKANISDLDFVDRKPDFYRLLIDVELRDAEQLHAILHVLQADSDVAEVERYRTPERQP